ncbi:OLC1v1039106C1 [Oldenlandia corymbosa var. corymbosa]|uniref:OLC1v1039106C1 n=1 Tax=Oldenlandia corymbosa var. corymbosa TaxID=529605 RepID=A0AAV1D1I7_OLDCO|nr:OLC1v1039106C1 [Oldenlandia corymbosa var. corymbosa]
MDQHIQDLKEFDDQKTGVKGLVDSGIAKIPKIFICPPKNHHQTINPIDGMIKSPLKLPIINLDGFDQKGDGGRRAEIVDEIRRAMETWGFFQLVNHGVPAAVLADLLRSTKEFQEQPQEEKMEYYSRDHTRKVKYYSTGDLYLTKTAQWKDTLSFDFEDTTKMELESLPQICREEIGVYINSLNDLKNVLSELISEALGLGSDHLESLECLKIRRLLCHYYPPCPEPDLTMGILKHSDPYFLTILLQDHIPGFQVFHDNQWLDVPPLEGSLLINGGDMLQLITNGKFKSVEHRVIAGRVGPRISAACFLYPNGKNQIKPYGPLKELVSADNPPKYRETSFSEYVQYYASRGLGAAKALDHHFQFTNKTNGK